MAETDLVLVRGRGLDDSNRCIPFGILSMAQVARGKGFRAGIIDRHLFPEPPAATVRRILAHAPRVVGFSAMTGQFADAKAVARLLREEGYGGLVVFGGPHVTPQPEDAFPEADLVIRKEGENALLSILRDGMPSERILDGEPVRDLDEIPLPGVEALRSLHPEGIGHFNILTARGCPFRCSFCLGPDQREQAMRYHSVEYSIEYIRRICAATPARIMFIMDDIFALKKRRVLEFCEALKRAGLGLRWYCFGHAACGDEEMFRAMKDAGCFMVSLGVESGSPEILKMNHKNITLDQVRERVGQITGAGLKVEAQFLFGLLGDTEETMRRTIAFAEELSRMGASPSAGYVQPYPGSELNVRAAEFGRLLVKDASRRTRKALVYLPGSVSLRTYLHLHRDFELRTRGRYRRPGNRLRCHLHHSLPYFYWRELKEAVKRLLAARRERAAGHA